jgi:hypothetical protein
MNTTTTFRNPQVPYLGSIHGSFRPQMTIRIKGVITDYSGRCVIDFKPDSSHHDHNLIFHISMRPNENAIVRNSYQHGCWGHEERGGHNQIRAYEMFDIAITAEHDHYRLTFNHQHFGVFRHRMPLHMVNFFRVSGAVTIHEISIENTSSMCPPSYPTVVNPFVPMPAPVVTHHVVHVAPPPPPPSRSLFGLNVVLGPNRHLGHRHHRHHHKHC